VNNYGRIGDLSTSSNNSVLVTGTNSAWTNTGNLYVGDEGSSTSLVLSHQGRVINNNGYIGYLGTSSNNIVTVTGTNSAWTNTGNLYVGYAGSSNSLVISNRGSVINSIGYIGYDSNSSNNIVTLTGTNSAWTNRSDLVVGEFGSGNSLVISDGGSVMNEYGVIGDYGTSSNNIVTVAGTGSAWTNTANLFVGYQGSGNSLAISNEASVLNGYGYIGYDSTGSNNSVTVTGAGSTWTNLDNLFVGYRGSGNSLMVSNGASVLNGYGYIGYESTGSHNIVTVTGTGSTWTNLDNLFVGYRGSGNSLMVSNGASVLNGYGYIGYTSNSSNNSVVVTGTNSTWTNTGSLSVGYFGSGNTLTVANGGSVSAASLTIASQTDSSGTLNIGSLGGSDAAGSIGTTSITFGAGTGTLNFNQSDTLTLSQAISGDTGTNFVSQLGSGTTVLTGDNTYTGTTTILAGTLQAGRTNALGSSDLSLGGGGSTGRLSLATTNLAVGAMSWGSNGIVSLSPGYQRLTVNGSMTNTSGGGTFEINTLNNNTNVLVGFNSQTGFDPTDFRANNISGYTFELNTNNVSGIIATNAVVVVSNNSTVSIVGGDTLQVNSLTIDLGSTLRGTGTLIGNLTVDGTLAPGNSPGTFFISAGNLTMGSTSTWDQQIQSTSVYDIVDMSGTGSAALNGTLNVSTAPGGSLQYGNQYNFLVNATAITGTFSSIVVSDPSIYRATLITTTSTAGILFAPTSYTLVAQSPNQVQVAGALNSFIGASGDRGTVSTALDQLSASAYGSAFEQIMPSVYSSLPTLAFNTANALNTKLFERIWLMQVAGLSGSAVAGDSPTQNNDNNPLGLKEDQNWSPFVDANGVFASANSGGTLDTYNAQNGGVTTGGMYKFLPNLMAGGYAGYQYTHAGYDGSTSMEDNAARFGLLASWAGDTCYRNTDNIYLNGLVGGQMHNYNVDRQIEFSDINRTANATPTAGEFDSAVQVGYNIREGGFTFGPQASLQYTYLGVGSFNESGADSLDLNVDSFNSSSMMFTLGGQGAYRIEVDEDFAVIPMADASWQHECLQNPYGIQSAFTTGGPSEAFNFQSSAPLRDFFYGGVGVGFAIGQNWQVSVLWNASAANADLASQNIYISAAARF
jgi:T5SS/PEP-CTERM-associated repeat protein